MPTAARRQPKLRPEAATLFLGVGESYSGVQFHTHAQGWFLGIWGRKRWLLYPSHKMPARSYPTRHHSVRRWSDTLLPLLRTGPGARPGDDPPVQCVVHPGQLLTPICIKKLLLAASPQFLVHLSLERAPGRPRDLHFPGIPTS